MAAILRFLISAVLAVGVLVVGVPLAALTGALAAILCTVMAVASIFAAGLAGKDS